MRGFEDKAHINAAFAISRDTCLKSRKCMDPFGRKKVQTDFLMLKNWNLGANFLQIMHHD